MGRASTFTGERSSSRPRAMASCRMASHRGGVCSGGRPLQAFAVSTCSRPCQTRRFFRPMTMWQPRKKRLRRQLHATQSSNDGNFRDMRTVHPNAGKREWVDATSGQLIVSSCYGARISRFLGEVLLPQPARSNGSIRKSEVPDRQLK